MNHSNPELSNERELRQLILDESRRVKIDADAILAALSRWVGWYRMETMPPYALSAKEKREEADAIVAKIEELDALLHGMSPDLKCQVGEAMRHVRIEMPDLARLRACFIAAKSELVKPRRGKQANIPARDNALCRVREAVGAAAPTLSLEEADQLAAELVSKAASCKVPKDAKELRRILRG